MLKKTTLALFALSLSSAALAGTVGNPAAIPTGTPLLAFENSSFWSIGLEYLYVKSSSPEYQYAQIISNSSPVNTLSNQTVDAGFHSNFELDATYHFSGTDRDVTLAYVHADMEDSNTSTLIGGATFAEPFGLLPGRRDFVNEIKGASVQLYNGTDFVFGQHMHIGQVFDIHPFGGLRYADLNSRDNSTYYNDTTKTDVRTQATAEVNSHYEGLGPRAGMDVSVIMLPNLSLVATLGGSLEFGSDNPSVMTQTTGNLPTNTSLDKNWYGVPELDAKLGINYQQLLSGTTSMEVQLGYQAVNYFDAIENDSQDIFNINSEVSRQNFGFQGPYVRLQLDIA